MDAFYLPGAGVNNSNIQQVFSDDDYGIFDINEDKSKIKDMVSQLTNFRMTYHLRNRFPINTVSNMECYNWDVYQNFDFTNRNHLILRLQMEKSYCDDSIFGNFWGRYIWLHLLCIIFSAASMALNIKYIADIIRNFNLMKEKFQNQKESAKNKYKMQLKKILSKNKQNFGSGLPNRMTLKNQRVGSTEKYKPIMDFNEADNFDPPEWSDLTAADKTKLFSRWSILIIAADIILIMGSVFLMMNTKTVSEKGELFLGFGAMLTWISLIKYYENAKGYNIITNTIENSSEIIIKAILGILPVFIAYGIIGTCLFWRSHRFNTLSTSLFSLFAVMNGDMIFDCWHDIDSVDVLFAQIFLYTFIGFSICVVLNTFIVIIEDGYVMQKYFARSDWVKGVNQGASLHMIEHLAKEGKTHHENTQSRESLLVKSENGNDASNKSVAELYKTENSQNNLGIPMIHGVPIPHEGDPFVRILKKSKKDIRSRTALIKMLMHDKLDILHKKIGIKEESSDSFQRETLPVFGRKQNDTIDIVVEEKKADELVIAKTPEAIARRIIELMEKFEEMRINELKQISKDKKEEENDQVKEEDINERYKFNLERITEAVHNANKNIKI